MAQPSGALPLGGVTSYDGTLYGTASAGVQTRGDVARLKLVLG
jgi:hypothetical protein